MSTRAGQLPENGKAGGRLRPPAFFFSVVRPAGLEPATSLGPRHAWRFSGGPQRLLQDIGGMLRARVVSVALQTCTQTCVPITSLVGATAERRSGSEEQAGRPRRRPRRDDRETPVRFHCG